MKAGIFGKAEDIFRKWNRGLYVVVPTEIVLIIGTPFEIDTTKTFFSTACF